MFGARGVHDRVIFATVAKMPQKVSLLSPFADNRPSDTASQKTLRIDVDIEFDIAFRLRSGA